MGSRSLFKMNEVKEKWPEIIEHLRVEHELLNVSFNTWIKPLKVYDVIDDTAYILVNKDSSVEYIDKKYRLPLMVCIAEITGKEYEIQFVSEDDDKLNEIHNASIDNGQKKKTKSLAEKAGLNPKYTFDSFVIGNSNRFAHGNILNVLNTGDYHGIEPWVYSDCLKKNMRQRIRSFQQKK